MTATHKRLRRLVLTGGMIVVALGLNVVPASAHHTGHVDRTTSYNDGYGTFAATSAPNEHGCADYSNYTASLTFPSDGAEATVSSTPLQVWGEFWDGTYEDRSCPTGPGETVDDPEGNGGEAIAGFTGTLTTADGVCQLSDGTYRRGHMGSHTPELNVTYEFATVTGNCGESAPVTLQTTIVHQHHPNDAQLPPFGSTYTAACNSPIAPQTCELGPQEVNDW